MRKFLLVVSAVALFAACSDNGGSDGGSDGASGGNINYEEGYKYLASLNVSDAKMIYQKSSTAGTRAEGDDTYYKLDLSGREVKLFIKGEDGQDHNIGIDKVVKLSDKILLIAPAAEDIIDLFYKPGPDEPVMIGTNEYLTIVDVQTEKLYRWPKEVMIDFYKGVLKTISDNQGNIYFASSDNTDYPYYSQIYKLDVSDFTIQKLLPDHVVCNGFMVTDNGFVVYWNGNIEQQANLYVKCPGGKICPISDTYTFVFSGNLYSILDNMIIQYKTVGNNDLEKKEICAIPGEDTYYWSLTPNYVRGTMVLNGNYEFDGEKCRKLDKPVDIGYVNTTIRTNKAWYTRNNNTFSKIAMKDYQESQFQVLDYEIQNLSASQESPNITFTGYRYLDGASVVATITESDEVVIDNIAETGNKIINLIPLN